MRASCESALPPEVKLCPELRCSQATAVPSEETTCPLTFKCSLAQVQAHHPRVTQLAQIYAVLRFMESDGMI